MYIKCNSLDEFRKYFIDYLVYGLNIQPYTYKHIVYPLAYGEANNKIHLHMKVIHWWRAALFSHMREQSRTPGLCVAVLPGVPWPQIRLLIMCHHHQSAATGVRKCLTTTYFLFIQSTMNGLFYKNALSMKFENVSIISDIQVQVVILLLEHLIKEGYLFHIFWEKI